MHYYVQSLDVIHIKINSIIHFPWFSDHVKDIWRNWIPWNLNVKYWQLPPCVAWSEWKVGKHILIWTDILCFHQPSIVQSVILFVFVHNPTLLIHQSREIQHTINDTIYTWQPDNSIKLDTNNTFAKVRYLNIPYTTCWHVLKSSINILIQFRFSTCCMSSAPTIC